ncbi:hypothetical protein CPB84DRAFT_1486089 [Gymnopilus junonius]|uniref:Uncharacterized protein n=1 Tax=Gymnopilus junonius TaxID=109634 RepID=A0A9P5N834_GYMJU|nr:hypothetical protein CPB84DRAFT_1486089 [Gymnopilus junonius]
MLGFRSILLAATVLLVGSALAAPSPSPHRDPVTGERAHLSPADTFGNGIHPAYSHNFGSHVAAHGLGGPHSLHEIPGAHELVRAHNTAAREHGRTAAEHRSAHRAHLAVAQAHTRNGNHAAAAAHLEEAHFHRKQAALHTSERQRHRTNASSIHGHNSGSLHTARLSSSRARLGHTQASLSHTHAKIAHAHLDAAHSHHLAAQKFRSEGDHEMARYHSGQARVHRTSAARLAPGSLN